MPVGLAVSATLNGMAFGIFPIVWIVVTAIWVYNMTVESGEFEIIKNSLACITDDRRLQALFIAFAFGSFIEGTAGFGTPVAITAAMLVGLGFQPVYAAGICLIANTAPVAFGAIGIPIVVAAGVTGLDMMHISQIVGRQLPFLSCIVPLWLVVTMSGWKSAMEVLPAIIVAGLCFAVSQFVVSNYVGPYLPDIISAIVTIVGLGLLLRFWKPATIWRFSGVAPTEQITCQYSTGSVVRAWLPYGILAIMVFLWGLEPVKALLKPLGTTFDWPMLHKLVIKTAPIVAKDTPYPAVFNVNIGSAAGTAIFIAGLLSVLALPNYGYGKAFACLGRTIKTLKWAIATISMILGLAYIMNYSAMSSTLGLAFTATGALFPYLLPNLGLAGGVPDRLRYFFQRPVRLPAKDHGAADRGGPQSHGGGQLQRRGHREDDFSPEHLGGHRGHWVGRGRGHHFPVYPEAQHCHGAGHLGADAPAGIRVEVYAAVKAVLRTED